METITEEPMDTNVTEQPGDPEYEGEGRLIIDTEAAGEYIEELCDDPLADKKTPKHTVTMHRWTSLQELRPANSQDSLARIWIKLPAKPVLKIIQNYQPRLNWRRR